jgi:DNA modification methylase
MNQPVLPRNQILVGDVRTRLAELPDASVNCIITSPPYWAVRDYGHDRRRLRRTRPSASAGWCAVPQSRRRL